MLHILIITIFLVFTTVGKGFTQGVYFREKVDFFKTTAGLEEQREECTSCNAGVSYNNLDFDKHGTNQKALSVEKKVMENFNEKDSKEISILLFINPGCKFSDTAIKEIIDFENKYPDSKGRIIISSTFEDFKKFVKEKGDLYAEKVECTFDINNKLSDLYEVGNVPSFIIKKDDKVYKISGQIDLEEIVHEI